MTTLSEDAQRVYQLGDLEDLPVIAADIIYEGAAVGENGSGYSRPLQGGDAFQGFAVAQCDNSGGSAGDKKVTVRRCGYIEVAVTGATIASNDKVAVYASDDDTFTTTATGNSLIGWVSRHVTGTTCVVRFDAFAVAAALAA